MEVAEASGSWRKGNGRRLECPLTLGTTLSRRTCAELPGSTVPGCIGFVATNVLPPAPANPKGDGPGPDIDVVDDVVGSDVFVSDVVASDIFVSDVVGSVEVGSDGVGSVKVGSDVVGSVEVGSDIVGSENGLPPAPAF